MEGFGGSEHVMYLQYLLKIGYREVEWDFEELRQRGGDSRIVGGDAAT